MLKKATPKKTVELISDVLSLSGSKVRSVLKIAHISSDGI